jgi:hypothetical protein
VTRQRLRRLEGPPESDALVLRGDLLDAQTLRKDALANYGLYGFYGISVWVPSEGTPEEVVLATKLRRSRFVLRFTAGDLYLQRLELWATGQSPHYDVVYTQAASLDSFIEALMTAPHVTMINPHYDPEGGSDR